MIDWAGLLRAVEGFDWDGGNDTKSLYKHQVACEEAEQVFRNRPIIIMDDSRLGEREMRAAALGQSDAGKMLRVVFTVRSRKIRVISARPMSGKEKADYEKAKL